MKNHIVLINGFWSGNNCWCFVCLFVCLFVCFDQPIRKRKSRTENISQRSWLLERPRGFRLVIDKKQKKGRKEGRYELYVRSSSYSFLIEKSWKTLVVLGKPFWQFSNSVGHSRGPELPLSFPRKREGTFIGAPPPSNFS